MSIPPAGIFPENRVRFPAAPESRIFPAARNRRQEKVAAFRTFLPVEIDHEEVGDETEFDALDPVCRSIFKGVKALRRCPGDTPELEKAMKVATSSCVSDFRSNNSGKADTAVFCCSLNRPEFSLARSGGGAVAHDPDCSILSLKFPRRKAADLLTPHGSGAGVDNRFYSNSLQLRTCDGENPVMRRNSLEK